MALELLKCSESGDFGFGPFVKIDQETDTLAIKFQKGPIKENGENGAQIDALFEIGRAVLMSLNEVFPCHENTQAIEAVENAVQWLRVRKSNREKRGVEGLNLA